MKKYKLIAVIILTLLSQPSWAHRVNIFAWSDGDEIAVESKFAGGSKVRAGDIQAIDALTGEVLLTGKTNNEGNFRFHLPEKWLPLGHDLRIVINAGEGHRNEWLMRHKELPSIKTETPESLSVSPEKLPFATPELSTTTEEVLKLTRAQLNELLKKNTQEVTAHIEKEQVAPLRRQLAESQEHQPGIIEIVGGMGWILGTAGILAWYRRREHSKS